MTSKIKIQTKCKDTKNEIDFTLCNYMHVYNERNEVSGIVL